MKYISRLTGSGAAAATGSPATDGTGAWSAVAMGTRTGQGAMPLARMLRGGRERWGGSGRGRRTARPGAHDVMRLFRW